MSETPTTTQPPVRVQHDQYDECPICGCPVEKIIDTVLGGSYENSSDTKQERTCVEPIDPADSEAARVRLFFHTGGDLDAGHGDQVVLDRQVNDD